MPTLEHAWYTQPIPDLLREFNTTTDGLSHHEAETRLQAHGPNVLPEQKTDGWFIIFLSQFKSPLIYLLFAAGASILLLGETIDALIIFFVLLFNAVVGTVQEGRAQNALRALRNIVTTRATVIRDGLEVIIPDEELVPGDVIILTEGERIPADARVVTSHNLTLDEAVLSGESEPVHKTSEIYTGHHLLPAEQKNMLFKGTHVVAGNGTAVVTATGSATVIGGIARRIATIETDIPLQANMRDLSHLIIRITAGICAFLFVGGILTGTSALEMFATVVSLSVSIIPEGLPIVMTLILATGVRRMSKRNALVKKLQAVEALGQARIIAVDKTGTITKNEMTVQQLFVDGKRFSVSGVGYAPKGDICDEHGIIRPDENLGIMLAAKIAALCAKARVMFSKEERLWRISGDPTEAALAVMAEKIGIRKETLETDLPLRAEIPFDYKLKYHAVIHGNTMERILAVSGAPEAVIRHSATVWHAGNSAPIAQELDHLQATVAGMSKQGLRVIALAMSHEIPDPLDPSTLRHLTLVGLVGMKDALRAEAAEAVQKAEAAGIRVVMITGDHVLTAQAIATEAGIFHDGDTVLTGTEIDALSDADLKQRIEHASVFARVTPEHKLRIIGAYKARGEIISMTGDGVNDAPSLVAADLGVAMGKVGTEVAKAASDIVLLDDNFGSIIAAVEEGRNIYIAIKKVILYLFSTSLGETLTLAIALFLGFPLPILPAQIIWLNFVTDGFLDVSLAMEPKETGLLSGRFQRPGKYFVDRHMGVRMLLMALTMAGGALLVYTFFAEAGTMKARTITLTTLAVFQWLNAWNCRSETKSLLRLNPLSNPFLIVATGIVISLQFAAIYHPFLQGILKTTALSMSEWMIAIGAALSIVLVEETRKLFSRSRDS